MSVGHPSERVRVFGIRHHGPGSARALVRALDDLKPDIVLIEGPPEADAIVDLAGDPGMTPPVALLAYAPGDGGDERHAAFWPFAEFSPEWQAIRHAAGAGVPVRFCDLPAAHQFADDSGAGDETQDTVRTDPLGLLAEAAGYDDAERWWDDVVELRGEGPSPFEAIAEAMATLREDTPAAPEAHLRREEQREAYMRKTLRRALKEGYERIAVVCGAWHVPAIEAALVTTRKPGTPTAARDDQTLRGLPKAKVAVTWVPWTHGRLANWTGYGAGVRSPGWYHHLFTAPDRPIERWLTDAARVLREEDLPASSAHVIEAVRLADALAALRGRPLAGLDEVTEATLAVLCEGAELPVELIQRRMVVAERLGSVPDSTPMVPLQRDLSAEQRRLKLKPSAEDKEQDLDLRKPNDLDRSRLLHRLRLLGVPWGKPARSGGKGTFRETWTLGWRPEFDVELIEASAWGTTVRGAASARAKALAAGAESLSDLTSLAERCLLADLGETLPSIMSALADQAAVDTDVAHLMAALPALVRTLRYGDVRGTPTGPLRAMVDGLVVRVQVGLPPAVSGLDDDAARMLLDRVDEVHDALALLDDDDHIARWRETLAGLVDRPGLHGLLEGRLTRLLLDAGLLDDESPGPLGRLSDRMARVVSVGEPPARAAAWIEGFLAGGGLVLVHDDALLRLVDAWVASLTPEAFVDVLPLLRRTFARFESPERRAIGERVTRIGTSAAREPAESGSDDALDTVRADPAGRTVAMILGWQ